MQRLDGSTTLPSGTRVRLRLPQAADGPRLRSLMAVLGLRTDDLGISRLLRIDPRERVAVVATVLAGRSEAMVGFAAMDRFDAEPGLVLADELQAPGIRVILEESLRDYVERARHIA